MDQIIKDSSIWRSSSSEKTLNQRDTELKLGMIRGTRVGEDGVTFYQVEVWNKGTFIIVPCLLATKWGGIYNYEEYIARAFTPAETDPSQGSQQFKAGDQVLVAYINGDGREGVILSGLKHIGRQEKLKPEEDNIAYFSIFNGIQREINYDGEYTETFRGQPTNLDGLLDPPSDQAIAEPEYDDEVGTSFYKWDKTGSFTLSDNATEKPQIMKFDKPGGIFSLNIGDSFLTIDKNSDTVEWKNKVTTWNSDDEWSLTTKLTNVTSSDEINMTSAAINTEGEWDQKGNMTINGNIDQTGNFANSGTADIAGGSHPLIYDIVLTIGTGNLGAPVISNHTFLKTVKTKAT